MSHQKEFRQVQYLPMITCEHNNIVKEHIDKGNRRKESYFILPIVAILFVFCAELTREFTTIVYTRDILIVNDITEPVTIKISDSICCNPKLTDEYIMGDRRYLTNTINLGINDKNVYKYYLESTIEDSRQNAIDTFNTICGIYRKLAFHIKSTTLDTIHFIPWKKTGLTIVDLPDDDNSIADKIGLNCSDTIHLSELFRKK